MCSDFLLLIYRFIVIFVIEFSDDRVVLRNNQFNSSLTFNAVDSLMNQTAVPCAGVCKLCIPVLQIFFQLFCLSYCNIYLDVYQVACRMFATADAFSVLMGLDGQLEEHPAYKCSDCPLVMQHNTWSNFRLITQPKVNCTEEIY